LTQRDRPFRRGRVGRRCDRRQTGDLEYAEWWEFVRCRPISDTRPLELIALKQSLARATRHERPQARSPAARPQRAAVSAAAPCGGHTDVATGDDVDAAARLGERTRTHRSMCTICCGTARARSARAPLSSWRIRAGANDRVRVRTWPAKSAALKPASPGAGHPAA
jgi:hypothetical protein